MGHFVHTNGIQLHFLDHPGGDSTLVLMPGLTANANSFDGLIKAGLSPMKSFDIFPVMSGVVGKLIN